MTAGLLRCARNDTRKYIAVFTPAVDSSFFAPEWYNSGNSSVQVNDVTVRMRSMAVQVEFLESTAHFSGLGTAELEEIKRYVFEKTFDRNEMILHEDERPDALYFVASGAVKIFKTSEDGKEQILYLVRPGESLNDVSALDGSPNPVGAQAMGPVSVYGIGLPDLEAILRDYPQVALNVANILSQQVRRLMSLVEDLSFRHVIGRVARILLEYAGDGSGARPRLTQQDMAAMAGTAREMVGRSLKVLEEEGTIRLDRHRIVISNRDALRGLAGVES